MRHPKDASLAGDDAAEQTKPVRAAALSGLAFTVLLLLSAGMASVPDARDSTDLVRNFYLQHTEVILIAQAVGAVAAAVFAMFARLVALTADTPSQALPVRRSGYALALAAAVTAIPVLWLCAVADNGSADLLHRLTVASDWTDVLLFATIAAFSWSVTTAAARPWLRAVAVGVGVLAAARAVLLALGRTTLELAAPLAFLALVIALSAVNLSRLRSTRGSVVGSSPLGLPTRGRSGTDREVI